MKIIKDKYVLAVEYLVHHPHEICQAWNCGGYHGHAGGQLFRQIEDDYRGRGDSDVSLTMCLTQARKFRSRTASEANYAPNNIRDLVIEIINDETIPENPNDIQLEDLNTFVCWQRRLDEELQR